MVQKRLDGSVNFYRGWDDYKRGFGNLSGEFWLGLDKIHRLTRKRSKLRVDPGDFSGNTAFAQYNLFEVGGEGNQYRLSTGTYSGKRLDLLGFLSRTPCLPVCILYDDIYRLPCSGFTAKAGQLD